MRYTVSKISGQSGLAAQTIREYADRGILASDKDVQSRYRYFDANAVNQLSAIRRLRMMGFSLGAVEEIMTSASYPRFQTLLEDLLREREARLAYERDALEYLKNYKENLSGYGVEFNTGEVTRQEAFYCLDYRKNGELLCQSAPDQALLNQWMDQALFLRNYSPYPESQLLGENADHVIGFILDARYARYVPVRPPVRLRPACLCAAFYIRHDDAMRLLPDGPGFVAKFLRARNLRIAGEPFFVGDIPFFEEGKKVFMGRLYVPVADSEKP